MGNIPKFLKVGSMEQHTWATLTGWEVALAQALGDYVDVILKNAVVQNVQIFMHQFPKPFDPVYAKKSCIEPYVIKRELIFLDVYRTQKFQAGLQN